MAANIMRSRVMGHILNLSSSTVGLAERWNWGSREESKIDSQISDMSTWVDDGAIHHIKFSVSFVYGNEVALTVWLCTGYV